LVDANVQAISLRRRQQIAAVVDERDPLQMRAAPCGAELRLVPTTVVVAREPFVPDRKRVIEDALTHRVISNDDVHALHAGRSSIVTVALISAALVYNGS
jgi:hypothetical protein